MFCHVTTVLTPQTKRSARETDELIEFLSDGVINPEGMNMQSNTQSRNSHLGSDAEAWPEPA